jgi:YegS/Rv2252/BmrU family lipid kinase
MRKAALFYNPDSGGSRPARQAQLEPVLALLRHAGVEAQLVLPQSAADACEQVQDAVQRGCDTIFACGGDGTIHNLVQVLANTPTTLAILPMGTANALAHDIGLPTGLLAASRATVEGTPRRIALGKMDYLDFEGNPGQRYFIVAAGMGVDAHLFYKLHTGSKQRMGMAAYYANAWHLWLTYSMARFQVEYSETGSSELKQSNVTELMAVRIRNFGGVLRELAPGAALERDDVRLVFCTTASRAAFLLYVTRGLLGRNWKVRGIELAHSRQVSCKYLGQPAGGQRMPHTKIYVEADGELVGTLPARISMAPDALTLLVPSR